MRWIPITRELPPLFEKVLVTTSEGILNIGTFAGVQLMQGPDPENQGEYYSEYQESWVLLTGFAETKDIKAWMILPEPYK